ncbi:hypothetical protein NIES4106_61340 (plasmid) [Fischerella sp. NIES-4106]|nr:hypothetical protein NIES4106_61340 [Fischerella sp. NIES-4106]
MSILKKYCSTHNSLIRDISETWGDNLERATEGELVRLVDGLGNIFGGDRTGATEEVINRTLEHDELEIREIIGLLRAILEVLALYCEE